MAHTLKHIAFRIWSTVLLAGLACLGLLPFLDFGLGSAWTPVPAAVLTMTLFLLLGWPLNRLALYLADRHIREAAAWERVGSSDAAGAAYEKALAVFDSFLISPRAKRLESGRLASKLTRFYLARTDKQFYSEAFIAFYLNANPDDHEVAENWLRQVSSGDGLQSRYHETAARIGESLAANRTIQHLLAKLYLSENRTDFPALQAYRRATGGRGRPARAVADKVARLFLKDGRADEWALRLYLQALADDPSGRELLNGIAACVHWMPETARNRRLMTAGQQRLEGISEKQRSLMRVGFTPPKPLEGPLRRSWIVTAARDVGRFIQAGLNSIARLTGQGLRAGGSLCKDLLRRAARSALVRPILNWTAVALLSLAVMVLIVNTVGYLARTRMSEKTAPVPVEKVATGRFTLQVAAYLKKRHAEQYVAVLKAQGIDAFWIETTRRDKRWYQVRVSRFPDKAAARAYGQALKQKGVIDDFYVANYALADSR